VADSMMEFYMQPELNTGKNNGNDPHDCFKCTELGNNLHHAFTELSSLQVINELLFKELEGTTAKLQVTSGIVMSMKADETRKSWRLTKCKEYGSEGHGSTGENNNVKCTHTPYPPVHTNNRYDILLNFVDYTSSKKDVAFVIKKINKSVKMNQKTCHDTRKTQTRHQTKRRIREPEKVMKQYGQKPVNVQEDYTKSKKYFNYYKMLCFSF
jgi:hypothetical protein